MDIFEGPGKTTNRWVAKTEGFILQGDVEGAQKALCEARQVMYRGGYDDRIKDLEARIHWMRQASLPDRLDAVDVGALDPVGKQRLEDALVALLRRIDTNAKGNKITAHSQKLARALKEQPAHEWGLTVVAPSEVDPSVIRQAGVHCFPFNLAVRLSSSLPRGADAAEILKCASLSQYAMDAIVRPLWKHDELRGLPPLSLLQANISPHAYWHWSDYTCDYRTDSVAEVLVLCKPYDPQLPRPTQSLYVRDKGFLAIVDGWDPECLVPSGDLMLPFYGNYDDPRPWPEKVIVSEHFYQKEEEENHE